MTKDVLTPAVTAQVRRIQIRTHRLVSDALQGAYRSSFRGTGIEFEEVRPYQPGDEVRSIDWNVTARTGEPHVKTYVEERQLTLHFLVDESASMSFGSRARTKRETAAEAVALLSLVAVREHDRVGLTLFDRGPGLHLDPASGTPHVLRVVREILAAPASRERVARDAGGSPLAAVLEHVRRAELRRSLLFLVSDFRGGDEAQWERPLAALARRHDAIALHVSDPLEEELPRAGLWTFEDPETGACREVDTSSRSVRRAWSEAARERRTRVRAALGRARVPLVALQTDRSVADPLVQLFRRRARGRATP